MIGFVGRAWAALRGVVTGERRGMTLADPALAELFSGSASTSGAVVTENTALALTPVYACVRIIAETVGSLPLNVYKSTGRGKEIARTHPLHKLLHRRPNPWMTAFTFRETMVGHLVLRGNAFAHKVFNGAGQVTELWPIHPDAVEVAVEADELYYNISIPGEPRRQQLPAQFILHLRGFGGDGISGYSPIRMAREAMGLAMACEQSGAKLFGNGSTPGGILSYPGTLTPEAKVRLKAGWEAAQGGLSNRHRVALLENGLTWTKIGVDPADSQFLETRRFQLAEIARWFRVPLHLLQELENASYATVEQQGIDFTVHTVRPWCERIEQEMLLQLFTERDQELYFPKHKIDGLLRGDLASRYTAYATARQWGWLSVNDILELEDRNPIGPEGDVYLQPMNMSKAGDPADPPQDQPKPAPEIPPAATV